MLDKIVKVQKEDMEETKFHIDPTPLSLNVGYGQASSMQNMVETIFRWILHLYNVRI